MSAPAPGRPRSLGASLLDQVLAETVDPAYAQAAADRAARTVRPGADGGRLRRSRGQLLVALTLLIAGLLAAVTYRQAAAGEQGREQARQALRDDIADQSGTADDLTAQLEELTARVTSTREGALAASVAGQGALERLTAAEQGAALLAVSGPGLRIELDNATPSAESDPVGGSTEVAGAGLVQDGDLQLVVNALWASGAEAISINGQRIGATTAIRQAGQAILVDLRPVNTPYEVSAIGDPQRLQNEFVDTPEATAVAKLTVDYGVVFTVARSDDLELPAGSGAELRFAELLDPAGAAGQAPADGAAGATGTDPTTGG